LDHYGGINTAAALQVLEGVSIFLLLLLSVVGICYWASRANNFENRLSVLPLIYTKKLPQSLRDPISERIMNVPVTVYTGVAYDKFTLMREFDKRSVDTIRCVKTGLPINKNDVQKLQKNIVVFCRLEKYVSYCQKHASEKKPLEERRAFQLRQLPRNNLTLADRIKNIEDNGLGNDLPEDLYCPISNEIFGAALTLSSGRTYNLAHITRHANTNNISASFNCPITRNTLSKVELTYATDANVMEFVRESVEEIECKSRLADENENPEGVERIPPASCFSRLCSKVSKCFAGMFYHQSFNPEEELPLIQYAHP
jgi:hypothetical protein